MKKIIFSLFFLFVIISNSNAQLDDILKKIPGVNSVFQEAVTTSIKDAYPTAYWLGDLDKKINVETDQQFNTNLQGGYYQFKFNTFCLHAGAYAPTEGAGYLVAPLKGGKAGLIKNILSRYADHPEIDQKDVQMLIWGVEANQKFTDYPADFQFRVQPLLNPEDIAMMEVDLNKIAYDLLPGDVQNLVNYYGQLRGKLSDATATYEDVEQIAVKTGIAPIGKGSKNITAGTWTSIGDGVYMRSFPEGYKKANVEIYIPSEVTIEKDSKGNITSMDDGSYRIEYSYEGSSLNFKTAVVKNTSTGESTIVENSLTDNTTVNKVSDDFIGLVKKSFSKKKKERLTGESLKTLNKLKMLETTLGSVIQKSGWTQDAYSVSVNAVNSFVSEIESGTKKGGGKTHITGLSNVSGLVYAPANTANQRLGNGGPVGGNGDPNKNPPNKNPPKEKDKDCKVKVYMSQVGENELPEPDYIYTITVTIDIQGEGENCHAEEINFTLFDVSKERGRCINDLDQYDDVDEDLQISDQNSDYNITTTTASKTLSGKSQTQQIKIKCRDWGAFGKLKAVIKANGTDYEAEADATPDKFVTIPLDLNDNKIADSWEKKNNVYGKPAAWDEDDKPGGQARTGDGLTNYEEYRGLYVSDGDKGILHIRTDPNKKDIFIIDDDKIFPKMTWEAASSIHSEWLTSGMVYSSKAGGDKTQYRWVNFCSGFAAGVKYAVRLIKVDGMPDPYGNYQDPGVGGYNYPAYGPPKKADMTVVFPDRARWWLTSSADSMEVWLKRFPAGFQVGKEIYTPKQVKYIISEIRNPAKLDVLVSFWVDLNVVHEVGHACNVYHHGGGDTTKTSTGDPKCPMKYRAESEILNKTAIINIFRIIDKQHITPVLSYTGWRFCKKNDNCWKQLDVNDR